MSHLWQDKNVNIEDTTTPLQKILVNDSQPQPQPQPKAQLNVEGTGRAKVRIIIFTVCLCVRSITYDSFCTQHEDIDIQQRLSSSTGPPDIRNETTPQPQPQLKAQPNVKGTGQAKVRLVLFTLCL